MLTDDVVRIPLCQAEVSSSFLSAAGVQCQARQQAKSSMAFLSEGPSGCRNCSSAPAVRVLSYRHFDIVFDSSTLL